jgi:3-hydroxyacyl-CoA dehydrogenase/3a,7a,12a-trihydroxy-5b-cholest-24-enoyl-CoA hydratase
MVIAEMEKRGGGGGGGDAAAAEAAPAGDAGTTPEPTSWDVFIAIRDFVERNPDMVGKTQTIFRFELKDPDSAWTLDLKNGKGAVIEGTEGTADCTLALAERDFLDMTMGKSDPMKLFTTGKLKISGNVMASQKLQFLQKIDPQQAMAAVAKARAAGGGPKQAAAAGAGKAAKAPMIFTGLETRLKANPGLKDEVKAKVVFRVKDPDGTWTFDLGGDATTTITISDADLADLSAGKASAKDLFQHGKLRVDGDYAVAQRLGFLKGLV